MNEYPDNWKEKASQVKEAAGWHCIRYGDPLDQESGHVLTVHHLDMDKANCEWWNLAALCQRCHLHIQAKVNIKQIYMFEHSEWFKPYVAGYYANEFGLPDNRDWVNENIEYLLNVGFINHTFNIMLRSIYR